MKDQTPTPLSPVLCIFLFLVLGSIFTCMVRAEEPNLSLDPDVVLAQALAKSLVALPPLTNVSSQPTPPSTPAPTPDPVPNSTPPTIASFPSVPSTLSLPPAQKTTSETPSRALTQTCIGGQCTTTFTSQSTQPLLYSSPQSAPLCLPTQSSFSSQPIQLFNSSRPLLFPNRPRLLSRAFVNRPRILGRVVSRLFCR